MTWFNRLVMLDMSCSEQVIALNERSHTVLLVFLWELRFDLMSFVRYSKVLFKNCQKSLHYTSQPALWHTWFSQFHKKGTFFLLRP